VALLGGYLFQWDWTGFSPYTPPVKDSTFQRGKTLWDWLQLLLVPILLAVGGFWLNQIQKSREEKAAEHRAKIEREAAEKRAQTEREVALDNQREAALQAYIDKMSDLLLENKLRESPQAEAKEVARARTFTVLPRLDALRKRSVVTFLYASGLIDKNTPIISLAGADLCGAHLREINLYRAYLHEADLSEANLHKTDLSEALLDGADLWKADLSGADLHGADLDRADLSEADLSNADLHGANLDEAILRGADLHGAILNEANLQGATGITAEELEKQAKSIQDATMPDGSKHP